MPDTMKLLKITYSLKTNTRSLILVQMMKLPIIVKDIEVLFMFGYCLILSMWRHCGLGVEPWASDLEVTGSDPVRDESLARSSHSSMM